MSEAITKISIAGLVARHQPLEESVYVGKDVFDVIAGSMYVDPLDVYREYIQNAADSIDDAHALGLALPPGQQVTLSINHSERSIRIRDFGTGIPSPNFIRRLTTIGASGKRGKHQRGFRGIGRLSGLGYCQELIFRSRAEGESKVSEMRWDGRILREKMRDPSFVGGLAEIAAEAVSHTRIPTQDFPVRFFEVELRKVKRFRNDLMLNEAEIKRYLSEVAPVPFSPDFSHGEAIQAHLDATGVARTVDIRFDGDSAPIYHRAVNEIQITDNLVDTIDRVELVQYAGIEGEVVASGWLAHHSYMGAIPKQLGFGGIRLRVGNIQVGDELILAHLFPEPRFAAWTIGDIHIVSSKISPNARRDEFEPSVHYVNLQNQLILVAKEITRTIRTRSKDRNLQKRVQIDLCTASEWMEFAKNKRVAPLLLSALASVATAKLHSATLEAGKMEKDSDDRKAADRRIQTLSRARDRVSDRAKAAPSHSRSVVKAQARVQTALTMILNSSQAPKKAFELASQILEVIETTSKA